jgi:rhodanese-related sulfurtransferase
MKKFFACLTLLFVAANYGFAEDLYEDDLSPKEAYEMQKEGAVIIDVRTPSEFIYAEHPLGAINVPVIYFDYEPKSVDVRIKAAKFELEKQKGADARKLYDIGSRENKKFVEDVKKIVAALKPKAILVLCHSGQRSQYAANILAKSGLENVYNVDEGIIGWKEEDLPTAGE